MKDVILNYINNKDMDALKEMLATAEEMEILQALYELSSQESEEKVVVFRLLAKDTALSIFEKLDTGLQRSLLDSFTNERVNEFINDMSPDDRVRLLDELPAGVAKRIIGSLSPEERAATNVLMGYEPKTAGRIMTTEYISLKKHETQKHALDKVCQQAKDKETIYTLFVTDNARKLEGVLSLKELLVAETNATLESIMSKKALSVSTDTEQEKAARILHEYDLLAVPVVDKEERLVGIITIDDAVDILEEESEEYIYDQAGLADIKGIESDRSDVLVNGSMWKIWKVRLPFLVITLAAGMLSGLVINGFEDTLESIAAVAIFIPLIMDMGGNVGTQSSTVFVRGVVLGHIKVSGFLKHFLKEVGIGFSIGLMMGIVSGVIASLWQGIPALGIAVGIALVVTMTLAALLGFLVPYVLIKLNVDQAAGSAPIITSIKDISGLVIYFVLVNVFLYNLL